MSRWIIILFFAFVALACAEDKGDKKKSNDGDADGPGSSTETTTDSGTQTAASTDTGTASDPDTVQTGDARTPVLAFFGGYTSCGLGDTGDPLQQPLSDFFERALAAVKEKTGQQPKYLIACYTLAYESVIYRFSGDSQSRNKLIAGMENDFEDFLGELDHPEILMVGHSYGGWTAMDIVQKLPPGTKIKGLVTLDPISHADCNLSTFGGAECKRAPQDFGEEGLKEIKDKTAQWLNYWEDGSTTLHSGEIAGAQNVKRTYPGSGFGPHNAFLSDDAIGDEITALAEHAF